MDSRKLKKVPLKKNSRTNQGLHRPALQSMVRSLAHRVRRASARFKDLTAAEAAAPADPTRVIPSGGIMSRQRSKGGRRSGARPLLPREGNTRPHAVICKNRPAPQRGWDDGRQLLTARLLL